MRIPVKCKCMRRIALLVVIGSGSIWAQQCDSGVTFSGPIIIQKGGTYTGNWESADPSIAAVRVWTSEPVLIVNSRFRGSGELLLAQQGSNLTVRNSCFVGAYPNAAGARKGTAIHTYQAASVLVENCDFESIGYKGIWIHQYSGDYSLNNTFGILKNRVHNVDGRLSDGNGGYLTSHQPSAAEKADAIHITELHGVPGIEVAWNQIINEPYQSLVEDSINIWNGSGAPANPMQVHDNYIEGGYAADPAHPNRVSYSGSAFTTDGSPQTDPSLTTAFVKVHDNQAVNISHNGIGIGTGHDIELFSNRVVSSGQLGDGANITTGYGDGVQQINFLNDPPGVFGNNSIHDNFSGVRIKKPYGEWERSDYYFPLPPAINIRNDPWLPVGATVPTLADEANELSLWDKKLIANGITIGSSLVVPPVCVARPASLVFTASQGEPAPPPQIIKIVTTSAKGLEVPFTAEVPDPTGWLTVSAGRRAAGATPSPLSIEVNPAGLAVGSYQRSIAITAADGAKQQVPVFLNVNPPRIRVLFDETHAERNTIRPDAAKLLNSAHPEWVLFGILAQELDAQYRVTSLTSGSLTGQTLGAVDVLVLAAPNTSLSVTESQAIANFVQAGGALIFLGDADLNTTINTLLGQWGIQFDRTLIKSRPAGAGSFDLSSFSNHPAVAPDGAFKTNFGGSLVVSQGAVALGFTSSAEWKSVSGQVTQQPGEPNGPFVMVAAAQAGKGRVFVVSDNAFHDDYLKSSSQLGNLNLFLSALAWLTAPAPSATASAISSVTNAASFKGAVAAGGWATIFGQNLANTPASGRGWSADDFSDFFLPTSLAGTSVRVDGRAAAISFVSPNQLNVQIPDYTASGSVKVEVNSPYGLATGTASVQLLAPAIFPVAIGNTTFAAAVGLDGVLIAPPVQIPGARLARPGESLQVFGTGFGETVVHQPAGQLVNPTPLADIVTATVCGQPARVSYAGLVGVGLNQINITVPTLPPGNCPIQLTIKGAATQDGVVLPVGQ
jgi:uncharacterized protein (TIGR03437 family)